jgi:hypothetical protein
MQYQCQLAIHPTQPSPTQLSLQEAQRCGNPSPNCLCKKPSDVAILYPTVFARSAATWQYSTQLSLREAQRRGNLSVSLGLLHSVRNDGERSVREDECIPRTPIQLSLREAQRRGNLSVSLAEMISLWQCGFFTKEPQRNEATLCLYII